MVYIYHEEVSKHVVGADFLEAGSRESNGGVTERNRKERQVDVAGCKGLFPGQR